MPPMTTTGDISYRTAGYFSKQLLERSQPLLVLDKFGQPKPLPAHSTRTIKFRGYEHLPNQPKALIEGVTPQASKPTFKDIEATINQYGDWIELTDVLADTHEDPLISEFSDILGEQAAIMRERITAGVVLGGTNVFFSGETAGAQATSRNGVNRPLTLELQRRVTRMLKRQLAMPITSFVSASPNFKTESVLPSYVAICHTDCEADIREMRGFLDVKDYGGGYKPMPGEIGSVEGVRYMCTTVFEPWADAGAAGNGVLSSTGACADVYPVLYLAKNAFGIIPFNRSAGGKSPIVPMVLNPNIPRGGEPFLLRGGFQNGGFPSGVRFGSFFPVLAYKLFKFGLSCRGLEYPVFQLGQFGLSIHFPAGKVTAGLLIIMYGRSETLKDHLLLGIFVSRRFENVSAIRAEPWGQHIVEPGKAGDTGGFSAPTVDAGASP